MDLVQTIILVAGAILLTIVIGFFLVIAFAMNAYYSTDEGQEALDAIKKKKKK